LYLSESIVNKTQASVWNHFLALLRSFVISVLTTIVVHWMERLFHIN
jgi:hypothetical protein